jgi:hypothetical protein
LGHNIDLVTGERLGPINSRPEHVKAATEGMLMNACGPITSTCFTSTA